MHSADGDSSTNKKRSSLIWKRLLFQTWKFCLAFFYRMVTFVVLSAVSIWICQHYFFLIEHRSNGKFSNQAHYFALNILEKIKWGERWRVHLAWSNSRVVPNKYQFSILIGTILHNWQSRIRRSILQFFDFGKQDAYLLT
jgi:hypothetical protein